jgi:hypothetical protein
VKTLVNAALGGLVVAPVGSGSPVCLAENTMPNTAQTRAKNPRHLLPPDLAGALGLELRADKGPKHIGFDSYVPMDGRRALERALKQDRKR